MVEESLTNSKPLSVDDAASFTGYTKSYIYRLVHEKRIPYYKPGKCRGARIFFKRSDLEAFVYRGRCSADYELSEKADVLLLHESEANRKKPRSTASQKEKV